MNRNFIKKYCLLFLIYFCLSCDNEGTKNDSLLQTWSLASFLDDSTDIISNAPNGTDPIILTFSADELNGVLSVNFISGNYNTQGNKITIRNFGITEICCNNEWDGQFLATLTNSFKQDTQTVNLEYDISGDSLTLRYDENLFMNFVRN